VSTDAKAPPAGAAAALMKGPAVTRPSGVGAQLVVPATPTTPQKAAGTTPVNTTPASPAVTAPPPVVKGASTKARPATEPVFDASAEYVDFGDFGNNNGGKKRSKKK